MTPSIAPAPIVQMRANVPRVHPARPILLAVGTAVPAMCREQADAAEAMASIWNLKGTALSRWRRIVAGSEIQTRHGVMRMEEAIHLSTAQRMEAYERVAPDLAAQAAATALHKAGVAAEQVTDLIVVSCTGFSAPGLDIALVDSLGLQPSVRRMVIGFMGCFGAISGLRAAVGACAANSESGAIALVVCLELCSLHMRAQKSVQNQVASALFADGAAAAVVASHPRNLWENRGGNNGDAGDCRHGQPTQLACLGQLNTGASTLIKQGREWMTWRVTDAGFAMTLTRDVPIALRECVGEFIDQTCQPRPRSFIVHPGGPGILDAVDDSLELRGGAGLEASRAVLRRYGNMSSATVLFVLHEALQRGLDLPALLLAFGPGLTIESIQLLPDSTSDVRN